MKYKDFEKVITTYREGIDYLESLSDLNVDLFETPICSSHDTIFDEWLNLSFNEKAIDLIYWWLFEDVEKVIINEDESKTSIETLEELYNFIVENKWMLN